MKILRVSQEIYPYVTGGGAYHSHALSRDQASKGHDVTVLSIRTDISESQKDIQSEYEIIQFPSDFNLLGNDISFKFLNYLRHSLDEYDIVHAHAHFYYMSNISAILSRLNNVPLVLTNHSLISQSIPKNIAKIHLYTVGKLTFNSSDVVFCYTKEEKEKILKLTSSPRVEVISNGIDCQRFSPDGNISSLMDSANLLSVLFVGRFVNGKRPQDALSAFHTLRESGVDAMLYMCGDGPLYEQLKEKVARWGIEDSVTFLGLVDYDEMPDVYRAADMVILPSLSEGFPRTVLEALSTETPIITSDLEQIGPIVEQAGRTIDPGDVQALADHMIELANDSDLRNRLGENGRSVLLREGLTWEKTVQETTDIMESIVHSEQN